MIADYMVMESLRCAGLVERYHTWPTVRRQNVAEHTWHVMRIYVELFGEPSQATWKYMLYHDVAELHTGDLPYPVKARHHGLREEIERLEAVAEAALGITVPTLPLYERDCVKICDLLEMLEYGYEEMARGNQYGRVIVERVGQAVMNKLLDLPAPAEKRVLKYVGQLERGERI